VATTTRAKKTAQDLKKELAAAEKKLEQLKQRAYSEEIEELVVKHNIVTSFEAVRAGVKEASDIAILTAIGKAVGIKRLIVAQADVKERKKKE
jgi:hypothetical protein